MNKLTQAVGVALVASSLGGCATITRGTNQAYSVESRPTGATVRLSTGQTCETPCKLQLKGKDEFIATVAKDGYDPVEIEVESRMIGGGGAAAAGNILFGGIVGGVVDATNGSLNNLLPEPLIVQLARSGTDEEPMLIAKDGTVVDTVTNHNSTIAKRRGGGKQTPVTAATAVPSAPAETPSSN